MEWPGNGRRTRASGSSPLLQPPVRRRYLKCQSGSKILRPIGSLRVAMGSAWDRARHEGIHLLLGSSRSSRRGGPNAAPYGPRCHRHDHYIAEGSRPVDRRKADVRAADAYVIIVAWRYGYVPGRTASPADGRSITEIELAEAQANGKPPEGVCRRWGLFIRSTRYDEMPAGDQHQRGKISIPRPSQLLLLEDAV